MLLHTWEHSWLDFTALLHSPFTLNAIPATGAIGVELFFFISGFCLALPYARHHFEGTPYPTLRHFFFRRAIKILPSYWLNIALTFFVLPHPVIGNDRLWFYLWTHLLFIQTAFLEIVMQNINGVVWSLAAEAQFYLLFPLVIWCFRRWPYLVTAGMVAIGQCWRAYNLHQYQADKDLWKFEWRDAQLPGYLDLFVAGIIAAWLYTAWKRQPELQRWAPLWTVLACLMFAIFIYEANACYATASLGLPLRIWRLQYRIVIAATFLVFTLSALFAVKGFRTLVANRLLTGLSAISYNLYLWHQWLSTWFMERHIPRARVADPHADLRWQIEFMLLAWGTSILLATFLTYFWERPFLRGEFPWSRGRNAISAAKQTAMTRPASDSGGAVSPE